MEGPPQIAGSGGGLGGFAFRPALPTTPFIPTSNDGIVHWPVKDRVYIFKGDKYWRYAHGKLDAGYPRPISIGWQGIPDDIDGVLQGGPTNKLYFFKGDYCWRWNAKDQLDEGYPKRISEEWKGVPDGIDGVLGGPGMPTVFFKDSSCYWWRGTDLPVAQMPFDTVSQCLNRAGAATDADAGDSVSKCLHSALAAAHAPAGGPVTLPTHPSSSLSAFLPASFSLFAFRFGVVGATTQHIRDALSRPYTHVAQHEREAVDAFTFGLLSPATLEGESPPSPDTQSHRRRTIIEAVRTAWKRSAETPTAAQRRANVSAFTLGAPPGILDDDGQPRNPALPSA